MPAPPTTITVTVSGTPPTGTYTSHSPQVDSNGNITVHPGLTTITFQKGSSVTWSWQDPYISFATDCPFSITSTDASSITIEDDDPAGGLDASIEYRLYTSEGNFDPKIINKGTG